MKSLLILSGACLLAACSSAEQPSAAHTTAQTTPEQAPCCAASVCKDTTDAPLAQPQAATVLPRLIDFGATTCQPCIMMEPVLESLREHYAGTMDVEFIDVQAHPAAAQPFDISSIPTQIYLDANGTEHWRHIGYISEEDMLSALASAGIALPEPATK